MDLPGPLDNQIGPFPLGGWLLIGGTGVGLGILLRRHLAKTGKTNALAALPPASGTAGDPALAGDLFVPGGGVAGTFPATGGGAGLPNTVPIAPQLQPVGPTVPAITDNQQWIQAAQQWAINTGKDPLAVGAAAQHYIGGDPLTPADGAIIQQVLYAIGPPPQYVPAPTIQAPNQPAPTLPPAPITAPPPTVYTTPPPAPAPPPVAAPAPPQGPQGIFQPLQHTLQYGSQGGQVGDLQQRLAWIGYSLGWEYGAQQFHENTKASVQDFQGKRGLTVDGIVGPQTWASLQRYPHP